MEHDTTGLLIGYGSAGRRHAAVLSSLTTALAIVESDPRAREQATRDHASVRAVAGLEALDGDGFPWTGAVAVIATWGPSHAALFHALADRGVRRILCEKPMAASVRDACVMASRAEQDGIALAVNHYVRYAGLAPAVRRLVAEHELGEPIAVVVEGGAACLLTNGIHWIDFATELFGAAPQQVISTAYGEGINPRSPDLLLYGGTAVWSFGERREAVISFTNGSSVAPRVRVYLRDAVAAIDGDLNVCLWRRVSAAVRQYSAITRTGPADEVLFDGALPGLLTWGDGVRVAVEELRRGDGVTCSGSIGAAAVSACTGALLASRERRAIELPIGAESPWAGERWPIS